MSEDIQKAPRSNVLWLLAALPIALTYFVGLNLPLLGPDEPRYSQVAREMFERGDWVTPTLGGLNWFEKPVLLYWLQIASYNIFGVNEFAARFGSALFGVGTIIAIWLLAKAVEKRLPAACANSNFANWMGLITAATVGVIAFSRAASFDIILTFPIAASLASFFIWYLGDEDGKGSKLALVGFYFFIGIALLAKGLVGIVFPFAIVGFFYLISLKFPPRAFILSVFWGTILAVVVSLSWYLPMYQRNGWEFIDQFFIQHHFQRYTSNKYLHPQPFFFFYWVLPLMTIPWLPFFGIAIWKFIRRKNDAESDTGANPFPEMRRFAVAWIVVPLVFFTFSGSKLPGYILPVLPAALLLAGEQAWRFTRQSNFKRLAVQVVAGGTFVVVLVLAIFFVRDLAEHESVKPLVQLADSKGYGKQRIINLFGLSHNSEFYASGRLVRADDGKQKIYFSVQEILDEMAAKGEDSALVLVPLRHQEILTKSDLVEMTILGDNTQFAIAVVKPKKRS